MKKTKIVATIGPSTTDAKKMEELLMAGVNVMRMNFSHGDFAEHQVKVDNALAASGKTRIPVAFAGFGRSRKIRIGDFYQSIVLEESQTTTLTREKIVGDEKRVYVSTLRCPGK